MGTEKKSNTSTGKIVTAALIGGIAGAALGILFAPDKGSRTRKKIKEKGEDLADDFKDVMEKEAKKLKKKANHMLEEVEDKYEDIKSQAFDKVEAMKNSQA